MVLQHLVNTEKTKNKKEKFIYLAFNKPAGCVSALKDNFNKTVMDYIDDKYQNLHIIGRLDKDTTGLILLTNDGNFTHRITHPKKHISKTYEVDLLKPFKNEDKTFLENPFYIDYGKTLVQPAKVKVIDEYKIELTIEEGKFHQVKKMIFNIDNEVKFLNRVSIGKLHLKDLNLSLGEYKEIKKEDIL